MPNLAKTKLKQSNFSRAQLVLFALVFAIIGAFVLISTFAASNPNLPGDLNNDNKVDALDLSRVLSNYSTTNSAGDANSDNTVNALDLSIVLSHYGQSIAISVTNSIVNGQTLSGSVAWTATVPTGTATTVDFYIDGVNRWTEGIAPYYYNGDNNTLDTTTLSNGSHVFKVVATDANNNTATVSATATVSNSQGSATGPGIGIYALGGTIYSQSHLTSYGIEVADNDSGEAAAICGLGAPTKPLIYFAGADVNKNYNTGVDWQTAFNNGWLLKNSAGNLLINQGFTSNNVPDVGNSSYQQAWISNVVNTVKGYGCKGAFIDDVLKDIKPLAGEYPAKYPDQPSWEAAMVSFVKAVGTGLKNNGLYVAANATGYTPGDGRSDDGTLTMLFWQEIGPYLNGIMNESYQETSDGNETIRSNGPAWYQNWDGWQRLIGTAQSMGDDFIGISYGQSSDSLRMRYGKASFLLEWNGGNSVFMYNNDNGGDYWNTAWTSSLGQPTGAKTQVAAGVWMRQYSSGVVYVNTNTFSVTAGGHNLSATDAYLGP